MPQFKPISFQFIVAGAGRRGRVALIPFESAQKNDQHPQWNGNDGAITATPIGIPITDLKDWSEWYELTNLTLERSDGETLMINDAVVSISQIKNIVKTALQGAKGTVKEYINTGDYDIKITVGIVSIEDGVIVDTYPSEGIRTVKKFLVRSEKESEDFERIGVQSTFLDIFGINKMVITGFNVKQETHSNRQVIEIQAVSDVDYEIKSEEY